MNGTTFGLQIGCASHVGMVRERNEDSFLVLAPPNVPGNVDGLILVADGVGGANAGDVASGTLVHYFWEWFSKNSFGELVHYDPNHVDYYIAALKTLMEWVNEQLFRAANGNSQLANMGTTATVGVISNGRLFLGHVGDTRAYLLRQGYMQRLTADHSWVADEIAAGRLSESEAQNHPKRNLVNRVLGTSLLVRVDREAFPIQNQDVLIFASDGLHGLVNDEEIRQVVLGHDHLQKACNYLVALANQRGGGDNITVVAARLVANHKGSDLANNSAISAIHLGKQINEVSVAQSAASTHPTTGVVQPVAPRTPSRRVLRFWQDLAVLLTSVLMGVLGAIILLQERSFLVWSNLIVQEWHLAGALVAAAVWVGYILALIFNRLEPG